jgi:hypothetical protein
MDKYAHLEDTRQPSEYPEETDAERENRELCMRWGVKDMDQLDAVMFGGIDWDAEEW